MLCRTHNMASNLLSQQNFHKSAIWLTCAWTRLYPYESDGVQHVHGAYRRGGVRPVPPAIVMALTGALGVVLYTLLKHLFVRERPFITHAAIDPAAAPLDRYSFPSGHTLHAVSFAWQASWQFPELGWVLLPLTG